MDLSNKNIIVTGGSGLIGSAIIDHIYEAGGRAFNFDIHYKDNLPKEDYFNCDIKDRTSIDIALKSAAKKGPIHGIVNNAYPRTEDWGDDFENIKFESWNKNVEWQLSNYIYICQQIIPYLRDNGSGSIVNISSIYGVVGNDLTIYEGTGIVPPAAYSAIKGGLVNFTRYLASYIGPNNIRVNCVSPGGVFNHQHKNFVKNYESKVPLKRMAVANEIAPSIIFLLSDDASYITGHNLIVDGGWTVI